eukprot:CAMPEP_0170522468 /NCGR_PEP_ID=MMETSP0209-20121228/7876_1 /TAXON_ID=665100 ORGANISM="Litonotus pictus, Strain P1" /NCGR_SAMPLE_ID=MMETSP0209 /ASSEMBLY_ACC=CAM_ASM_000301 /LENGTH=132 /DNA_ID=CAMNT_0010809981 /DNA_START=97 /DNA_END=491 /DNA_ORIENTATION=-
MEETKMIRQQTKEVGGRKSMIMKPDNSKDYLIFPNTLRKDEVVEQKLDFLQKNKKLGSGFNGVKTAKNKKSRLPSESINNGNSGSSSNSSSEQLNRRSPNQNRKSITQYFSEDLSERAEPKKKKEQKKKKGA